MTIKEQEHQLSINLNLSIFVTLIAYFVLLGFMIFRLSMVSQIPRPIEVISGAGVPTLKQDNFDKLSGSIKITSPFSTAPIVRPEPFD